MTRLLGLSAGAPRGSVEIMLKEALRAATSEGAEVELVRLHDLDLGNGRAVEMPADAWWLWERLLDSDGLILAAPIISRTIPGRLKLLFDLLFGPNADRAIVEKMLALREAGEAPAVPFRLDERVLRPRVAGLISVGGSLTPQWKGLSLPAMHLATFSMQTAVVDQFEVAGSGTLQSVVLDDAALARARRLGGNVGSQLGRSFEEAVYRGDPGSCPLCHLDVISLNGRSVRCATCGAGGVLEDDLAVRWTDLDTSVISMTEKQAHYAEILETAAAHATVRDVINSRAAAYDDYDPVVGPQHEADQGSPCGPGLPAHEKVEQQ